MNELLSGTMGALFCVLNRRENGGTGAGGARRRGIRCTLINRDKRLAYISSQLISLMLLKKDISKISWRLSGLIMDLRFKISSLSDAQNTHTPKFKLPQHEI